MRPPTATACIGSGLLAAALALFATCSAAQDPPEDLRVLVAADSSWHWLAGRAPYPAGWIAPGFDDSDWPVAPLGIGYGDGDDATVLEDMRGAYSSLALRQSFSGRSLDAVVWLELRVDHDDGFVAWLNGVEVARDHLEGAPPAHDALARDHEAGAWSVFEVPMNLLRKGENVLAIQVHNADLHSSDLSLRAELRGRVLEAPSDPLAADEEPAGLAPVPEPTGAWGRWSPSHALRLGSGLITNYFQARAGSPAERVNTGLVGYELELETRDEAGALLRLRTAVEWEVFDGLGSTRVLAPRFERRTQRTRLDLGARLKLDRPAFRIGDALARADTLLLAAAWTWQASDAVALEFAGDWLRETNDLDAARENEQASLSIAARFLPGARALSPQVGIERGRLRARDEAFDYDQWRLRLQLVSRPSRSTYLSLLLRWTDRDYATSEPTAGNFGRNDRKRLARGLLAWRPTRRIGVVGWASWEDGESSRPNRAYESWTGWTGLTLHF